MASIALSSTWQTADDWPGGLTTFFLRLTGTGSIGIPAALLLGCTAENRYSIDPVPVSRRKNVVSPPGQSSAVCQVEESVIEAIRSAPL